MLSWLTGSPLSLGDRTVPLCSGVQHGEYGIRAHHGIHRRTAIVEHLGPTADARSWGVATILRVARVDGLDACMAPVLAG
ncbi:hypothetical protein BH20CHL3_BH20CHL3_14170 [soil metagenome]